MVCCLFILKNLRKSFDVFKSSVPKGSDIVLFSLTNYVCKMVNQSDFLFHLKKLLTGLRQSRDAGKTLFFCHTTQDSRVDGTSPSLVLNLVFFYAALGQHSHPTACSLESPISYELTLTFPGSCSSCSSCSGVKIFV